MLTFLIISLLLFGAIRYYPRIEQRFIDPSLRLRFRQIYYLNVIAVYLTLLFSDSFYITHYLGWVSSILLVYGYFPLIRELVNH